MDELSSRKERRMNYLWRREVMLLRSSHEQDISSEEDEKRCLGLLPLTSDSLEMLRIWSSKRRQKWGRRDREIESEKRFTGEAQEHTNTSFRRNKFLSINICLFSLQNVLLIGRGSRKLKRRVAWVMIWAVTFPLVDGLFLLIPMLITLWDVG